MSSTPLPGSKNGYELKKIGFTHDAIIDEIIANPGITEQELGDKFGYSKVWISRLICSDAFQQRLALRKGEIIDPMLTATVEERLRGVTMQAIQVVEDKLEATGDPKLAIQFLNLTVAARGYGARGGQPAPIQNNFVVALPARAENSEQWAKAIEGEVTRVKDGGDE